MGREVRRILEELREKKIRIYCMKKPLFSIKNKFKKINVKKNPSRGRNNTRHSTDETTQQQKYLLCSHISGQKSLDVSQDVTRCPGK